MKLKTHTFLNERQNLKKKQTKISNYKNGENIRNKPIQITVKFTLKNIILELLKCVKIR